MSGELWDRRSGGKGLCEAPDHMTLTCEVHNTGYAISMAAVRSVVVVVVVGREQALSP